MKEKIFSLFGENVFIMGSLIWLWIYIIPCFCGHTNKSSFIIRCCSDSRNESLDDLCLQMKLHSCENKEENINKLLKMGDNLFLTYLLMKRQFSVSILSGRFTIFDLKIRESVWALHSLKWINLDAFFWSMKRRLIVHTFYLHIIHAQLICDSNRAC